MPNLLKPEIGNWYRHMDKGGAFQVVDADDEEDLVEVQSFEGDIESFSGNEWRSLDIETTDQPEDWTGPYDGPLQDDPGHGDSELRATEWQSTPDEVATDLSNLPE
jgi:hypothetical protein